MWKCTEKYFLTKNVYTNELNMGLPDEPDSKRGFIKENHTDYGKENVAGAAVSK